MITINYENTNNNNENNNIRVLETRNLYIKVILIFNFWDILPKYYSLLGRSFFPGSFCQGDQTISGMIFGLGDLTAGFRGLSYSPLHCNSGER